MEIVKARFVVETKIDKDKIFKNLEMAGRVSYKSEDKITKDSAEKFLKDKVIKGHESLLEHENITVRFICDRGVTHELVRHRLAAFTQESTRYVDYQKRGMQVIEPLFWETDSPEYRIWYAGMVDAEHRYNALLRLGATPQEARSVLPNSLKTEIVVTANIREWRHILRLRTAKTAHPQIREIMIPLLVEFKDKLGVLFDDI